MVKESSTELGEVQVHNDVICSIAAHEALKVAGVVALGERRGRGLLARLKGQPAAGGVRVRADQEERLVVDVDIVVAYGAKIPEVARQVQEAVLNGLQGMTEASVSQVNVHVLGVRLPGPGADQAVGGGES